MTAKHERQQVVLVTGGARRIGRAIVERFARDGDYAVAIHCNRSRKQGEALAAAIRGRGGSACVVTGDLSNPYAPQTLMAQAKAELGPVSVLINNAAEFGTDAFLELDGDRFDRTMAVNLRAPIFLARAMAAALPKRATGAVINILDQEVLKPTPLFFSYTLSKTALASATVAMAQALAPRIRVNGVAPGPTLRNERQSESHFKRQQESTILGRGATPDDVARAVRYLIDARAVTGQMIAVDGGQHLIWKTADVGVEQ